MLLSVHADAWRSLVIPGAPVSLNYIGIALVSATVITALRLTSETDNVVDVAAYGIVTRIFNFTFLPLMAIALATQSIVGNNVGAKHNDRAYAALRIALVVAVSYCGAIEVLLLSAHDGIGRGFVANPDVIARVGDIARPMVALYVFNGPVLVLALCYQAVGKPAHTAARSGLPFRLPTQWWLASCLGS